MGELDRHRGGVGSLVVTAAVSVAAALALTGSSDSLGFGNSADDGFLTAGEELIEGELADGIGLGPLDATCSGSDLGPGADFECSAKPGGLDAIDFVGTINDAGDEVDIASTNLLLAAQVEQIEAFAAGLIEEETSSPIGPENFECANTSLILSSGDVIDCLVTDPADGTVYAAAVTIDDLADLQITVNLGDPIG